MQGKAMKKSVRDYLLSAALVVAIGFIVLLVANRIINRGDVLSRAIDTIDIGTVPNDGTGDPLRTAFIKVNRLIVMADSLDLDSLTNDEVQVLRNATPLTDAVLFTVGDTTVTALVGRVVFKTSDGTFYGCVRATPTTRWEAFN